MLESHVLLLFRLYVAVEMIGCCFHGNNASVEVRGDSDMGGDETAAISHTASLPEPPSSPSFSACSLTLYPQPTALSSGIWVIF
ncbi:hypothetical protein EYF80_038042 [Liparis tanakae]|uniref:Secreted protein n=1 Tax=Liparis tanakae TaxID=230148 RepID=A0A4Z2GEV3_9TELE|nr:hypothetical protein EYF80_038042 [Liparis tanakae]